MAFVGSAWCCRDGYGGLDRAPGNLGDQRDAECVDLLLRTQVFDSKPTARQPHPNVAPTEGRPRESLFWRTELDQRVVEKGLRSVLDALEVSKVVVED